MRSARLTYRHNCRYALADERAIGQYALVRAHGDDSGLERSAVASSSEVGRPTRRELMQRRARGRQRWRFAIVACLVAVAVVVTLSLTAEYIAQRSWTNRVATIDHESCHRSIDDNGEHFTACALDVRFIDLGGRTLVAHLVDVQQKRIHANTVVISLDRKSPPTVRNPEDRFPLLFVVFFGVFVWAIPGSVAVLTARTSVARSTTTTTLRGA
jgi:hypothetical protein